MTQQVLIVDDNGTIRRILKHFLEDRRGVKVCGEATNGVEAVQKANLLQPDLILLDLVMPEMNGVEAASVLKKLMPNVSIIVLTLLSEGIARALTSAVGVDLVLSKSNGMKALSDAVDALVGGRSSWFPDEAES